MVDIIHIEAEHCDSAVKHTYIPSTRILKGDCLKTLTTLPDASIDSVVCDPPYHLTYAGNEAKGFMGKEWDGGDIAFRTEVWTECLRVLKPGGHLIAFGATRTIHRITCAVEDAGFDVRDLFSWVYFSGMPKSMSMSRAIDSTILYGKSNTRTMRATELAHGEGSYEVNYRNNGMLGERGRHERKHLAPQTDEANDWEGWGTALSPSQEIAVIARKPIEEGSIAKQVIATGTGALNIDACRIAEDDNSWLGPKTNYDGHILGRFPTNVYYCQKPSRAEKDAGLSHLKMQRKTSKINKNNGQGERFDGQPTPEYRNIHPTCKPLKLFRHLVKLVTPPGGTVLDPFAGSGTTGVAATLEGFDAVLCELTDEYWPIIEGRVRWAQEQLREDNRQLKLF